MAPSQEEEWKRMVNQDPCSGSVTGDSGHRTMTATGEDESVDNMEEPVGAVGGVDESVTTEHLSDVEWRDDDPLLVFDDDNVVKPQTPTAASTPVRTCEEEDQVFPLSNHLLGRSPILENLLLKGYRRWLQYALNLTMMMQN